MQLELVKIIGRGDVGPMKESMRILVAIGL